MEQADRFQLNVLNESLYNGCGGVAVFLAALAKVTGQKQFETLALRSLEASRDRVRSTHPQLRSTVARLNGLGGATGVGATIYSLVRTAVFLDADEGLLNDASTLASWLTPQVISSDEKLDVMSGAAGTLLSLLSLYAVNQAPMVLNQAIACGNHLLLHRTLSPSGHRAWETIAGTRLTGFSHGAAGISYALVRLYAVTHEHAYLEAAIDGIEFERSVFSERHRNWPDLRNTTRDEAHRFPVKWCHGAPGIALARLGSSVGANIKGMDQEIDVALQTTRAYSLRDTDFLCCGLFGRVESFLVAAAVTGRSEWKRLAEERVSGAVASARASGGYRLFARPEIYNPTFFQGTAGIGYELLRLAHDELPSILLWE